MPPQLIDTHIHPLPILPREELLAEMDTARVHRAVLLGVDVDPADLDMPRIRRMISQRLSNCFIWDFEGAVNQAKTLLASARTTNREIAELVEQHPDRFIGFGSVNVSKDKSYVEDKMKEIVELGLRGVKLLPTLQFFNPKNEKKLRKILDDCRKHDLTVTFHTGCDPAFWENPELSEDANPRYLKPVLKRYADVSIILAHAGSYSSSYPGIWLEEALQAGANHDNVFIDTAAVPYILTDEENVSRIRATMGLDRVLFGSDYPVVAGAGILSMANSIRNSPYLSSEEKDKVLTLNASKLFRL